jgi:biotin synthase
MTYTEGSCLANCAFCAQARESTTDKALLSRVLWPIYDTIDVIEGLSKQKGDPIERICLQVIYYPGFLVDLLSILKVIKDRTDIPISLDVCPLKKEDLVRMKEAGVEKIGIPLDAATVEIFDKVKGEGIRGPYRWENHLEALREAKKIFGTGNVMSNLIIGLGETEKDAVMLIQDLMGMEIKAVLFAFTPLPFTKLSHRRQPPLESYRRIQVARHIITEGLGRYEDMDFDGEGKLTSFGDIDIRKVIGDGKPFETTGCPGCNRPFYNERPSGPFYNYPRSLTPKELQREIELFE